MQTRWSPTTDGPSLELAFTGTVIYWRGPSPYHFVAMPAEPSAAVKDISGAVSYGWGCIPVRARIGSTPFTTALIPKDGRYLLPLKAVVRNAIDVSPGDVVQVELTVG